MRRVLRALLIPAAIAGSMLIVSVGASLADPGLPNVPAHRHFIQQPDGTLVQVGPRLCDDPSLQNAFNQFHNNAHVAGPAAQGPAAPGLHNGQGAELVARPCSFQPPS